MQKLMMTLSGLFAFGVLQARADGLSVAYVDCGHPLAADTAVEGRGGEDLPYLTIQAAVTAVESSGTVWVKPGTYATGTTSAGSGENNQATRVVLSKPVTLKSTGGRTVTHVVGEFGSGTYKWGPGSVRCLYVGTEATGSRIEGFTFRRGATVWDNESKLLNAGGGWKVAPGTTAWFLDCTVSNCTGQVAGGIQGGTAIRCLLADNISGSACNGYAGEPAEARQANLWNCVVKHYTEYNKPGGSCYADVILLQTTNVNCSILYAGWDANGNEENKKLRIWDSYLVNCLTESHGFGESFSSTDYPTASTLLNCSTTTDNPSDRVFAALLGDWRLMSTATSAIGIADKTALFDPPFAMPADMVWTDFNGRPLPTADSSVALNSGAIQEVGQVSGGAIKANGVAFVINGVQLPKNYVFHVPAERPFARLTPVTTKDNLRVACEGVGSAYFLCPASNGDFVVSAPYGLDSQVNLWYGGVQTSLWVSQTRGDDGTGDGTYEAPYATIQKAIDMSPASKQILIRVEHGDYATGGSGTPLTRARSSDGRVIRLLAVDGPEKTVIRGGDNVRCVSGFSYVQGFTLTGARFADTTTDGIAAIDSTLVDCVVSNNVGGRSSLATVSASATRILDNEGLFTVDSEDRAYVNCLIARNRATGDFLLANLTMSLFNCTLAGNTVPAEKALFGSKAKVYNSIIADSPTLTPLATGGGNLLYNAHPTTVPTGWTEGNPAFVDPTTDDYRLTSLSAAIGRGQADLSVFDAAGTKLYRYTGWDVDGQIPEYTDGRTFAGCYRTAAAVVPVAASVSAPEGGLAVNGQSVGVTPILLPIDELPMSFTLSATDVGTRPCLGFVQNGVTNLFADLPGGTKTVTVTDATNPQTVDALYDTRWYVDAVNGNDANSGWTPTSALRTLAAAATNACLRTGDTICALPGTYDEGKMKATDTTFIYSRVVVPAGVTLVSTEGPERTFIVGAPADTADLHERSGCGTGAVRCVYLKSDATLRGFTLTGGRASRRWGEGEVNCAGGGVTGAGATRSTVIDCVLSNCIANSGCAAANVSLYRCRVRDQDPKTDGGFSCVSPGVWNCRLYDCALTRISGVAAVYDCPLVVGCTVIPLAHERRYNQAVRFENSKYYVSDSVIVGDAIGGSYSNCVLTTTDSQYASGSRVQPGYAYADAATRFVEEGTEGLDAGGRPSKNSPVVDAGDPAVRTLVAVDAEVDCAGGQRTYNGVHDIGAYEYDWRGDYARQLGGRKNVAVAKASPAVVTALSGVALPGGSSLTFALAKGDAIEVVLSVAAGTVRVSVNGVLAATFEAGERTFCRTGLKPGDEITLVCSDEGGAVVKSAVFPSGLAILVR